MNRATLWHLNQYQPLLLIFILLMPFITGLLLVFMQHIGVDALDTTIQKGSDVVFIAPLAIATATAIAFMMVICNLRQGIYGTFVLCLLGFIYTLVFLIFIHIDKVTISTAQYLTFGIAASSGALASGIFSPFLPTAEREDNSEEYYLLLRQYRNFSLSFVLITPVAPAFILSFLIYSNIIAWEYSTIPLTLISIAVWILDLRRGAKGIAIMTTISFIVFLFFTFFSIIIASIMTVFVAVTPVFLPLESAIEDNHER